MKKILLSLILLNLSSIAQGQTINNISLDSMDVTYIDLSAYTMIPESTRKISIHLDYGQTYTRTGWNVQAKYREAFIIQDSSGNPMGFNTLIEAVNLLSSLGYEIANVYVKDTTDIHYVMRKKKK